jgi:uncharacterized membrane protein YhaH (DUF805 family)
MLASIFSFRGRINRLQYFGGLVGLFVSFVVAGVLAFLCLGDLSELQQAPAKVLPVLLIALIVLPVWVWISFSLQARRIRDIGLNPLFVIPAYIVFQAILQAMGTSMATGPAGSLASVASMMVDLAYSLALLFWPGRQQDAQPLRSWADNVKLPSPPATPAPLSAPITARVAANPAAAQPAAAVPFGRRGL